MPCRTCGQVRRFLPAVIAKPLEQLEIRRDAQRATKRPKRETESPMTETKAPISATGPVAKGTPAPSRQGQPFAERAAPVAPAQKGQPMPDRKP